MRALTASTAGFLDERPIAHDQDSIIPPPGQPARAWRDNAQRSIGETSEALFLSSGFVYDSAEQAEQTFLGEVEHFQYSRFGNPTVQMLEHRLALLEGAEACRATATGMAAVSCGDALPSEGW